MEQLAKLSVASGFIATGSSRAQAAQSDTSLVEDYVQLRARPDGRPVFWLTSGPKIGLVDNWPTPIYCSNVLVGYSFQPMGDGSYAFKLFETFFSTDIETGELLQEVENPFTGEVIKPPQGGIIQPRFNLSSDGIISVSNSSPNKSSVAQFSALITARDSSSEEKRVDETMKVRSVNADGTPKESFSEITTYLGHVRTNDAGVVEYTDVRKSVFSAREWPAWLNMNGIDGVYISIMEGRRFDSLDEALADTNGIVQAVEPKFAEIARSFPG